MDRIEIIRDVFEKEFGIDRDIVDIGLSYKSIPQWDSTSHMNLVLAIEERFGIEFESEDIVGMNNVKNILSLIDARLDG